MFEKVNPSHPDKVADRIAGAIVDLAYTKEENPRIAVEVLIGHGVCHIIAESSEELQDAEIEAIVERIAGKVDIDFMCVPQDRHLADNQKEEPRCGDNGIFKGVPISPEEEGLADLARELYKQFPTDGKMIIADDRLIICQSNATREELQRAVLSRLSKRTDLNPLGDWTGGPDVDTGATNRKLGSDMGRAATGGGLHGKDLTKADVSVNIYAHLLAQVTQEPVELSCAIGDTEVDGVPFRKIIEIAREYIKAAGGFEKFAEWGLI